MKIAIIHNKYQHPGGEDVVVAEETRLLEERGHKVVSYFRSNDELENKSKAQLLVLVKDVVYSRKAEREIRSLIREERPDLVHVHNTFLVISPSVYEACREEGVPVLQTLHNFRLLCPAGTLCRDGVICEDCIGGNLWNGIHHACYKNSHRMTSAVALMLKFHTIRGTWTNSVDGYVALSEFARSKFVYGGLPEERIHVKPNFVGSDPGAKTASGDFALFVGRLVPEKGPDLLLEAWKQIKNAPPLMIIGDGPLKAALQHKINSLGISNVQLVPWIPREGVLEAMKHAAFLVQPSTWYEGFPMTIVEAFACGTPVICSRLGSMAEIVSDGHTGLHFAAGNAADLADKVERLFGSSEKLAAMGKAARHKFENFYTAEKNYVRLMDIYERTIDSSSRN